MIDAIAALANRFWRIHPREIQDLGITREQYYEREMRAVFTTQATARIEALEASNDQRGTDLVTVIAQRDVAAARIEQLEARLDRAVTRGIEQVEQIATLEEALRGLVEAVRRDSAGGISGYTGARLYDAEAALAPETEK